MSRRSRQPRGASAPAIRWRPAAAEPWSQRQLLVLLGLAVVATALRLVQVESWSFTDDEVLTWRGMTRGLADAQVVFDGVLGRHPLVTLALRWLADAGVLSFHDEARLRLPFVFAGITSVPLLALAGRKLLGSTHVALLAAAMLAVHPWHVMLSRTATPTGFALAFALAALAAIPMPGAGTTTVRSVVCALCALLAIGSHAAGWLVLPVLLPAVLAVRWPADDRREQAFAGAALLATTLLPVLGLLWSSGALSGDAAAPAQLAVVARLIGWPLAILSAAAFVAVRPLPAAVACPAAASLGSVFLLAGFGAPVATESAVVVLPLLLLLAAATCRQAGVLVRVGLPEGKAVAVAAALLPAALLLSLLVASVLHVTVYEGERARWRAAASTAVAAAGPRHGVLVGAAAGWPALTCYIRPSHWRGLPADPHPGRRVERFDLERPAAALDGLLAEARGDALFVVLRRDELDVVEAVAAAKARLWGSFRLVEVAATPFHGGSATLYLFRATES